MYIEIASQLAKLEPILGVAFALNLAYIGLPRFRYRERIREHVRQKIEEVKDIPAQHCETDWYKQVKRLASLPDDQAADGSHRKNEMPTEIWTALYVFIFERHQDRFTVCTMAFICAALLFMGVAHDISYLNFTKPFFDHSIAIWFFWLTVAMAVIPVLFVSSGRWVVDKARKFADSHVRNLKLTFQREAQEAEIETSI